jgi:hypothetical protein
MMAADKSRAIASKTDDMSARNPILFLGGGDKV